MMYDKVLNCKLNFINLVMDNNVVIEFLNDSYVYIKLLDFIEITVVDEKFFDVNEYGLKASPDIYGVYELRSDKSYRELLIVGIDDILIVKTSNYKITNEVRNDFKITDRYLKRINRNDLLNYNINQIKLGSFSQCDMRTEINLKFNNHKLVYISENYFEAFKIIKKTKEVQTEKFIEILNESFPVIDYIERGYYHHINLNDNEIAFDILFSGTNFEIKLFELDC